ncbi:hypothetical protein ACVBEG_27795 [Pseudomonas sp. GG8]
MMIAEGCGQRDLNRICPEQQQMRQAFSALVGFSCKMHVFLFNLLSTTDNELPGLQTYAAEPELQISNPQHNCL